MPRDPVKRAASQARAQSRYLNTTKGILARALARVGETRRRRGTT